MVTSQVAAAIIVNLAVRHVGMGSVTETRLIHSARPISTLQRPLRIRVPPTGTSTTRYPGPVSAQSLPSLLTVEEFDRIPNPPEEVYEVRHGEAVFVTFPIRQQKDLQRRLRRKLEQLATDRYLVDTEFPYRPLPEHELWSADVACVSRERYKGVRTG